MNVAANKTIVAVQPVIRGEEQACILRVLVYFDIFQYPLTKNEIRRFLERPFSEATIDQSLQQMIADHTIFLHGGFYSLQYNPLLTIKRKKGNRRAEKLLPKAYSIGRFLFHFPFVRAIGISGSLSKNFADEKADVDFFIITKANRLWMARSIMHLFKKITFLTGHQHYFCMNYYIDEDALLIKEQNIFTAVEVATLIPVAGKDVLENFFITNSWGDQFFPGKQIQLPVHKEPATWIKKAIECLFDSRLGDHLDKWLFKITTKRWHQKGEKGMRNKNGHTMQLITGRHFSRSNPGSFQEKVLSLYEQKLIELKLI